MRGIFYWLSYILSPGFHFCFFYLNGVSLSCAGQPKLTLYPRQALDLQSSWAAGKSPPPQGPVYFLLSQDLTVRHVVFLLLPPQGGSVSHRAQPCFLLSFLRLYYLCPWLDNPKTTYARRCNRLAFRCGVLSLAFKRVCVPWCTGCFERGRSRLRTRQTYSKAAPISWDLFCPKTLSSLCLPSTIYFSKKTSF